MSDKLKIAIIGCGGITAFAHVPELLIENNVEIAALCDKKRSRANTLKNKYNLTCKVYQSIDTMFTEVPSIDAVIISTYPMSTAEIAGKVIKKGVHVLIQKPLMYHDNLKKDLKSVKPGQQIMALPYIELLDVFKKIKAMITADELGNIQFSRIRTSIIGPEDYYNDVKNFYGESTKQNAYNVKDYADYRGSLSDMGVYSLSLYHYLFGEAKLRSSVLSDKKLENSAILILGTSKKDFHVPPISSIESGWNQVNGIELVSVMGDKGALCLTTDGKLSVETGHGKEIHDTVDGKCIKLLPISPYHAQKKWIDELQKNTWRTNLPIQ